MSASLLRLRRGLASERGATMVEYGLMVALIAVIVALAVGPLGTAIAATGGIGIAPAVLEQIIALQEGSAP